MVRIVDAMMGWVEEVAKEFGAKALVEVFQWARGLYTAHDLTKSLVTQEKNDRVVSLYSW